MAEGDSQDAEPVRARKVPRDDARPQSVLERQATVSGYLIRRAQRRRDRFLQRSRTVTIRSELLRAGYLTGCILVDFLLIPEPIFLIPGNVGWAITIVSFVVAIGVEGWFYSKHFALKEEDEEKETEGV